MLPLPITKTPSLSFYTPLPSTATAAAAASTPLIPATPHEGYTTSLSEDLRPKFLAAYTRSFSIPSKNCEVDCTLSLHPFSFFRELNAQLKTTQTSTFGNGSTPASFFNSAIIPNDTDFLYRRVLVMDESAFHALPDKIKYLQGFLDEIRDAIEIICRRHANLEHLSLLTIFYAFFQKHFRSNDDTHCYGVVRLGPEFEIKYCIDIILTKDNKIVRSIPGVASCSFIQNDLFIPLDDFINGADPLTHPITLLSLKHSIPTVMDHIVSNRLDNDEINGSIFFTLIKKFTCTKSTAQLAFITAISKDLLGIMSSEDIFGRLARVVKENLQTQRIGAVCTLLNACIFIKNENFGRLLLDCIKSDTARRQLHESGHFSLYLAFFKIFFITAHCQPGQTEHISIESYEKQQYRLLIPTDLMDIFIHFFESLKGVPQHIIMLLYKEGFPQVSLKKEIKTVESLLTLLVHKGFGLLTLQEQRFLSHYLLFNFPNLSLIPKEGLIHSPGYLPVLSNATLDEKLAHYYIPSPPDFKTLLIPHDPQVALIGLQLIEHLDVPLQWAVQFTIESMTEANNALFFRLAPLAVAKEILAALHCSYDFEYLIQLFAQSAHVQINELACSLWMRAYERKMRCAEDLLQSLVYSLKDIKALKPQLQAILSKATKLSYLTSLLKLALTPQENSLETFTSINMASIARDQIVYIHSCVYHFIYQTIATNPKITVLKKLIHLFISLPPLQAPSDLLLQDKKEVLLQLSLKALLHHELIFELLPKIISDGYLNDQRFIDLLSSLLTKASFKIKMRILCVFKQQKCCSDKPYPIDDVLQTCALSCITETPGVAVAKAWIDLKFLIYNDDLSREALGAALQQLIEQAKLLEAVSFLTIIASKELYTLLSPFPDNRLYTAGSRLICELQRRMEANDPESVTYFKCCVNYLYILKENADEKSCYQMMQYWSTSTFHLFSGDYAFKLLHITRMYFESMVPLLTLGCLATADLKVIAWISDRLKELFKKQQLSGYPLAMSFQHLISYYVSVNQEYVADDLLSYLIENKIFTDSTDAHIWLSTYQMLLDALNVRSHEVLESKTRYIARLQQGLSHPTLLRLLTEPKTPLLISPSYYFIMDVKQQQHPENCLITCLQIFQNLLASRKEGQLASNADTPLLMAFGVLLESEPLSFRMKHWSILIENFITLYELGLFEDNPQKKISFLEAAAHKFTTVSINFFADAYTLQDLHLAHQFVLQLDRWFSKTCVYDARYPIQSAILFRNHAIVLTTASVIDESLLLRLFSTHPEPFLCAIEHLYGIILGAVSYFDHDCAFPEKHLTTILSLFEQQLSECKWIPPCPHSNIYIYDALIYLLTTFCSQKSFGLIPQIFSLLNRVQCRPECDLSPNKTRGILTLEKFTDCQNIITQLKFTSLSYSYSSITPYPSTLKPLTNTLDAAVLFKSFMSLFDATWYYFLRNSLQSTLLLIIEKSTQFIDACRPFSILSIFSIPSMEKIEASLKLIAEEQPGPTVYLNARRLIIELFSVIHSHMEPLKYRAHHGDALDIRTLPDKEMTTLITHTRIAMHKRFSTESPHESLSSLPKKI